jgi:NAD(P)-dependent dehydrogenase (short-subunit alcohol dehydrogenase family)
MHFPARRIVSLRQRGLNHWKKEVLSMPVAKFQIPQPAANTYSKSISELVSLKGKTAVVTGGARGIGLAICQRFMEAGANLLIADIDYGNCLDQAISRLRTDGREPFALRLDTRNADEMEHAADQAFQQFGTLDIWVNDAGIYPATPAFDISKKEWGKVISTNVTGVFHGAISAARHMREKGGVIINLSSVAGLNGSEGFAHYCASKYAVRGLTAALAKEFGEYNIRVIAIAPTLIKTPGVKEHKKEMDEMMGGDSFKKEVSQIPLGRIGHPDDVARVALFAASDLAAFVSGTTLVVDGGNLSLG